MDLTLLESTLRERGEPAYRAEQVWEWTARGAAGYDAMTNLPNRRSFEERLSEVLGQAQDWPAALDATERLALLAPNDPVTQTNRGSLHSACGYPVLALRYLRNAQARWPDHDATNECPPPDQR